MENNKDNMTKEEKEMKELLEDLRLEQMEQMQEVVMNAQTERALKNMPVIKKIVNADIGDIDKYYILKWFDLGWRDEKWVDEEIEFRKNCPLEEIKIGGVI